MSFTKKDLIKNIQIKEELSQRDSSFVLEEVLNFFKKNMGDTLSINKFGTFYTRDTPERIGRNPKTLETFPIKKRKRLLFSPSSIVKKILN